MCGLSGVFRWDSKPVAPELLKRMTDALIHRGPDDEGFYIPATSHKTQIGLGFRRLSIIDLSGGHQPMASADGSCHIVFNGEIYNFQELRSDLEKQGRTFRSKSDTEVILHLYQMYGKDCVQRLRGMFAFAIWDERKKQLFAARDRVGKKPFFYARTGNALYFASEMKALLEADEVRREVRLDSIPLYFTYQFIPSPRTIFKDVQRLPPAHTLTCGENGDLSVERYWTLKHLPPTRQSVNEICQELRHHLRESVRLRLISDVPLGAFLSGGLDSSAVVGLMAQEMGRPVKTFSIGFEESGFSELDYARQVARHFKTDHHEFVVKPQMTEILPKLAWHYDQPFADPSALPSYYVAEQTRNHVTVALNGDGGDENFGGYLRYQADRLFHIASRLPMAARRPIAALSRSVPPALQKNFYLRSLARAGSVLDSTPEAFNFGLFCYFNQEAQEKLYDRELANIIQLNPVQNYFDSLYRESDSEEWLDQVLHCDASGYLPDCLLVKVDIASMANSLEARSPLLDHKLMEYAARIPSSLKVKVNGGKWIFKKAMEGFVPDDILRRRKMGFGIPVNDWFRGPLKSFLKDHLLDAKARQRGYFKAGEVERLVSEHERGAKSHGYKLWALLMFELWNRVYVDKSISFKSAAPSRFPLGTAAEGV